MPKRIAQLDTEFTLPARPAKRARHTATTQMAARTILIVTSCMLVRYAPPLDGAVPKCTPATGFGLVHKCTDSRW